MTDKEIIEAYHKIKDSGILPEKEYCKEHLKNGGKCITCAFCRIVNMSIEETTLRLVKNMPKEAELHQTYYDKTGDEISLSIAKGLNAIHNLYQERLNNGPRRKN